MRTKALIGLLVGFSSEACTSRATTTPQPVRPRVVVTFDTATRVELRDERGPAVYDSVKWLRGTLLGSPFDTLVVLVSDITLAGATASVDGPTVAVGGGRRPPTARIVVGERVRYEGILRQDPGVGESVIELGIFSLLALWITAIMTPMPPP